MNSITKVIFSVLASTGATVRVFADTEAQKASPAALQLDTFFAHEISTAQKMIDLIAEFAVKYSFQLLGGIIVIFLGWLLAKFLANFLGNFLQSKQVDPPVAKFILAILKALVMVFAVIAAMGKFGITIAPFIAGLSVIGFGASFAVQGPLSNYAAGTTLIFTKPFKVGDIVEIAGVTGEVTDMTLARTELRTLDSTVIFVPNKQIIGEVMHNYSELKRLGIKVGISYSSDIDKAIDMVKNVIKDDPRVFTQPEPKVGISGFGDSSINIYARIWCKQDDYYDVMFNVNRNIFLAFKTGGIEIPFPQRDVHMFDGGQKKT